ncbi:MAG TPA: hypothetical protein VFB99_24020, partial [Vicinamibacterales bacterium]|nr:hypothetical protein [Vicinamibacterales bacterium]
MNFGELQDRVYQVLGDSRSSPREFPLARIRSLLNEGVQVFRQRAEDRWTRSQQSVTAGTGVYTYPDSIVRAIAIFYEDRLIPPATVMELSSENDRWRTETGRPRRFTADDVDWNQWRYFPIPDETTSESIVMNQNSGIVGAWQDPDGSYATFNQESGIIGYVSSATLSPEAGIVGGAVVSDVVQTTVWGVESPATMTGDGDAVPLKLP